MKSLSIIINILLIYYLLFINAGGNSKNGEINGQKIISNFRENHFRILILEIAIFLNILPDIEISKNENSYNDSNEMKKEDKNKDDNFNNNKIAKQDIDKNENKNISKDNKKTFGSNIEKEKEEKEGTGYRGSALRNLYLHGFTVTKIAEMLCNRIIKKGNEN